MFIWHEKKRRTNITKHGIDFIDAKIIFSGYTLTAEDNRYEYGEPRFLTLGLLQGEVVSVTHAPRNGDDRIISIRKATRYERDFYFSRFPNRHRAAADHEGFGYRHRRRGARLDARDVRAGGGAGWFGTTSP
uniref:Uncharacterized conserved protein, DUF497 family n=1 Tax=Candidatus Kentrum sp. TC TaxID=2126339 RepID=A0A450ZML5_9GAMM|nr:MAG: Uncharacterized conserved protein, DUF497 family [Candidatus Kentron sp. TC]